MVPLHGWLSVQKLKSFKAEAHVVDGLAYVEVDFSYQDSVRESCIKVYAEQPSNCVFTTHDPSTDEWDAATADEYVGAGYTFSDLEPLARTFCEQNFWNDEGVG